MKKKFIALLIIVIQVFAVNAETLEVTGSRKAVRTSGDILLFVTPVATLATTLALKDWRGLKQAAFSGVTTVRVGLAL